MMFFVLQIMVNDILFTFFEHRLNPHNISHIEIEGQLLLHKLIYESKRVCVAFMLHGPKRCPVLNSMFFLLGNCFAI